LNPLTISFPRLKGKGKFYVPKTGRSAPHRSIISRAGATLTALRGELAFAADRRARSTNNFCTHIIAGPQTRFAWSLRPGETVSWFAQRGSPGAAGASLGAFTPKRALGATALNAPCEPADQHDRDPGRKLQLNDAAAPTGLADTLRWPEGAHGRPRRSHSRRRTDASAGR